MPRVVVTEGAVRGLERCRQFLLRDAPGAAERAAHVIERAFSALETMPEIGRPVADRLGLRELLIMFGASGYVALYRYDPARDAVDILAFRHQREAGY